MSSAGQSWAMCGHIMHFLRNMRMNLRDEVLKKF